MSEINTKIFEKNKLNDMKIRQLIEREMLSTDTDKFNKELVLSEFGDLKISFETLEKVEEETKFLFPSYLIRLSNFGKLEKADEKSLKIMLENGSYKAYLEFKKRKNNNFSKMTDEFLIIAIQRGNGSEELETLMNRYKKNIERIINMVEKKYYFRGQDREDLIQEANIGLMKAIEVFKVERKTKFKDFSRHVIERHLGTLMYRSNNLRNRTLNDSISYNSPVMVVNSSQTTTFEELIEGVAIKPDEIFEKKFLYELIEEQLTGNEKEVLIPYADGYTYEEIAFLLMNKKGVMNFGNLEYEDVTLFLKTVASRDEFDFDSDFQDIINGIPEGMVIMGECYLAGYHYEEISKELKRRKKSVDNTIQRMRTKGIKQKYSFENDGKQLIEVESEEYF